jgi:iron complex outermembrane receptor protein
MFCFVLGMLCLLTASPLDAFDDKSGAKEGSAIHLDEIVVSGKRDVAVTADGYVPLGSYQRQVTSTDRARTSDTAALLSDIPGVSLQQNGGVSSFPYLRGLGDDRVRIKVDGMDLIPACPNHMNSPLSYIDPTNVSEVKVFAGITPVSAGGDSIAGTILAMSASPEFAKMGEGVLLRGKAGTFYRSNSHTWGGNLAATAANDYFSVNYAGSVAQAKNYHAARDFKAPGPASVDKPGHWLSGDEVGSSAYDVQNHAMGLALRYENHLADLKLVYQHILDEGFPNQRMDMTNNESLQANIRYLGQFNWGELEARIYQERTRHKMDFSDDKQFYYGTAPNIAPGMPMETEGKNTGGRIAVDLKLFERDRLRSGLEFQQYRLDDWWPPSPNDKPTFIGGMSPNTFWNINNGERDRYAVFTEWEGRWNPRWTSLLGVRYERVEMDTGPVQGYNNATSGMYYVGYLLSATNFNSRDRKRTDNNWDGTALARYTPGATTTFELGYAHKTRSPNLYERYSWSRNAMALIMNNFAGDGHGYLGNLDLKPEQADTVSATADVHSADNRMGFKVTPYYTHVTRYIDAVQWDRTNDRPLTPPATKQFFILKYMNQSAEIYGVDLSGHIPLAKTDHWGEFSLAGLLNYTKGKNLDTDDNLYNIMPLNVKLTVAHKLRNWSSSVETQWVDAKRDVSFTRQELETSSYTLVHLRMGYEWKPVRIDLGVENLFDKFYELPLGGAYVGQGATMSLNGVPWGTAVPGPGRSFYGALTLNF